MLGLAAPKLLSIILLIAKRSREDLFELLHNYTDNKSTSAILNIILQGVTNFQIIETVTKYISNIFQILYNFCVN